jgi:uncharacterized protein YraI
MAKTSRIAAFGAGLALLVAAAPAFAVEGYSTAHLNVRTGPGTQYPIAGMMEYNVPANITGCINDYSWCAVTVAGVNGWVSSEYLVLNKGGEIMQITGPDSGLPVVEAAVTEVVAPATVGVLVGAGGHVEAIVPEPAVVDYISATPVDPYNVQGEIVVGAVVPAEVTLYEVPGSAYGYTILNGVKVLVEPTSRAIVYIYRA